VVTADKLLVSVFGGFFLGMGIGLAVRGGAVLDGTETLAIYISRRTHLTIGDVILLFNILIFSVAAYLLGIETAYTRFSPTWLHQKLLILLLRVLKNIPVSRLFRLNMMRSGT
jgi:uncharacterized membrane-anchored protein YitT (DUF2179 family)